MSPFLFSCPQVLLTLVSRGVRYYEPEHWKFGEPGNKYFRHATGQLYAISKDLATYISINRWDNTCFHIYLCAHARLVLIVAQTNADSSNPIARHVLHKYINEDVSLGSWFIGLDVEHIDDRRLCCGTPPGKLPTSYLAFIIWSFSSYLAIPTGWTT